MGVLMTSLITLFTPLAADVSVWLLVAVRVLEGLFEVSHAETILLRNDLSIPYSVYIQM